MVLIGAVGNLGTHVAKVAECAYVRLEVPLALAKREAGHEVVLRRLRL